MTQDPGRPQQSGLHHLGLSVADLDRSIAWYSEVLGAIVIGKPYAGERASFSGRMAIVSLGVLFLDLFEHAANRGEMFDPAHTGLDHLGLIAESYEQLDAWARWLDANGVRRSEIREAGGVGSIFDFVDPDGIQLEFLFRDQAKVSATMAARSAQTSPTTR